MKTEPILINQKGHQLFADWLLSCSYYILASNSLGVKAGILLFAKSLTFLVTIKSACMR